eukprot:CAMPEP_0172163326 /NCGR_PEP_ID=MMETSP1050-20130122/7211_1 /TAXON_ID=233186 /ORGANISM="Cryptomonas curvata, Strain CCAP979/52" /LENGTH=355 /DNA_ID=CAMNT_0012833507 /DNA_START=154 /DNA_END=1221 /DNA_ORIENTATION=-
MFLSLEACTKFSSSVRAGYPKIGYDEDPGMPNAASLSNPAFHNVTFRNALGLEYDGPEMYTAVNLTWQPGCFLDSQQKYYDIHFSATNYDGIATYKLRIHIEYPQPNFVDPNISSITTRVGCSERIITLVHQEGWSVSQNQYYSPQIVLAVSSSFFNRPGKSIPVANLSGASFSVINLPEENRSLALFEWTPQRGQEAQDYIICINLIDFCAYTEVQSVCVNITVLKCQVCIARGETMQSVAANFNTDFLSLYTMNVAIQRPHRISSGTVLNTGVYYKVQLGDTLATLSSKFFTNEQAIFAMNPDIAASKYQSDSTVPGDRICLSVPVCSVQCAYGTTCSLQGVQTGGLIGATSS